MFRSIVVFVAVLLMVLFAISNLHTIQLRLFVGEPFNVQLISVMFFSFLIGVASTAYFFVMMKFHAKKKKAREEKSDDEDLT